MNKRSRNGLSIFYICLPIIFLLVGVLSSVIITSISPFEKDTDTEDFIDSQATSGRHTSGLDGEFILDLGKVALKENSEMQVKLVEWQEVNPNVEFMLCIDSIGIEEPVICHAVDNKQWLRTNIRGVSDIAGAVFLDFQCNLDLGLMKLVHGHNMKNGTMFGSVPQLLKLEDCADAPLIEITYTDGSAYYEIFAVLSVDSTKEALPIDIFATANETKEVLEDLLSRSLVSGGEIHSVDSIVLNTCWYGESGQEHNLHCIVAASRI